MPVLRKAQSTKAIGEARPPQGFPLGRPPAVDKQLPPMRTPSILSVEAAPIINPRDPRGVLRKNEEEAHSPNVPATNDTQNLTVETIPTAFS